MDPGTAREALLAQHAQLRAHLKLCGDLGARLRRCEPVLAELDEALAQLRVHFEEHNQAETALVRPLLRDSSRWGALLVERMFEEHVAEHAAFWTSLQGSAAEIAERLAELIDELDAHMAAEERTFLSPSVLDPNVIARNRKPPP